MSDSKFNSVVVLDAIPEGELNTARRLKGDLQDIACYDANGLQVRYWRLKERNDLKSCITSILVEIEQNHLIPWFHLDGHGLADENGFVFAGGSSCSWQQFKDIITPINVATNMNLIVILSTCFGGSFTRALETTDRAPVLGLIGPTKEVTAGEVDKAFPSFYKTLFDSLSLKKALNALDKETHSGLYYRTTAQNFFYDVWANYKTNLCTQKALENRAKQMRKKLEEQKILPLPSVDQIIGGLRSEESHLFEKYRDFYFMYDLDGNNKKRFPVTYEVAESYATNR